MEEAVGSAVRLLVQLLQLHADARCTFEAVLALQTISVGKGFGALIGEAGGLPILVRLLESELGDEIVRTQVVRTLGSIAADGPANRDAVLATGALARVLALVGPDTKFALLRNVAWFIAYCMSGKPAPELEVIAPALPVLARMLYSEDGETLDNTLLAVDFIAGAEDGGGEPLEALCDAGVAARVCELVSHANPHVRRRAVFVVHTWCDSNERHAQVLLDAGALPALRHTLAHGGDGDTMSAACLAVCRVAARGTEQIQPVLDAELVPQLVSVLGQAEPEVQMHACCALYGVASGATPPQLLHVLNAGAVPALCSVLSLQAEEIGTVAVACLQHFLDGSDELVEAGLVAAGHVEGVFVAASVPQALCAALQRGDADAELASIADEVLRDWFPSFRGSDGGGPTTE